jgi:hypothetical protein
MKKLSRIVYGRIHKHHWAPDSGSTHQLAVWLMVQACKFSYIFMGFRAPHLMDEASTFCLTFSIVGPENILKTHSQDQHQCLLEQG